MKSPQPKISAGVNRVFGTYSAHYVRKNFHTFRILKDVIPENDPKRPLVVYLNHAAWWDPLICMGLARKFFAERNSFAPIDAEMLQKYRFFKHLGFFPVEQNSARGARQFLRVAGTILSEKKNALWLTPQGRFADVRVRPPGLLGGLSALAAGKTEATFIPLAIEYAFWMESRPEILVAFGQSIIPSSNPERTVNDWTKVFSDSLATAQDRLAEASLRRETADWVVKDRASVGTNFFYDIWRWTRAKCTGESFTPSHQTES